MTYSLLRLVSVTTSDSRTLHAMWKPASLGTSGAFAERAEMPEFYRQNWREGAWVRKVEAALPASSAQQTAWDTLEVLEKEQIASVTRMWVVDEYIPLTKRGKLDSERAFRIYRHFDAQGQLLEESERVSF